MKLKFLKNKTTLILLFIIFLLITMGLTLILIEYPQIIRKIARVPAFRWCRDNSFSGSVSAPKEVKADENGNFSFKAKFWTDVDEACATVDDQSLNELLKDLPGSNNPDGYIPGVTRATTCIRPKTSTDGKSFTAHLSGDTLTVAGHCSSPGDLTIYLLGIKGIPICARARVTVKCQPPPPTPTPKPTETPQPTLTPTPILTSTPTPTEKPTQTPTPKPTSTPTNTPIPTQTPTRPPGQPTNTPAPTNTPQPTSTNTPTPTEAPTIIVQAPTETPASPPTTSTPQPTIPPAGSNWINILLQASAILLLLGFIL